MTLKTKITDADTASNICGIGDKNLNIFKDELGVIVTISGQDIVTDANSTFLPLLEDIFRFLLHISSFMRITERDIVYIIKMAVERKIDLVYELYNNQKKIIVNNYGKSIYPKTVNQKNYIRAIDSNTITFGIGAAGTGKTYLAVALGIAFLKRGDVKKLILTRPAIEAGESLGFLPGDFKDKIDPYLIPLYDALDEMIGHKQVENYIADGTIEIAPLAYMRGRTLDSSFVILDEAQNATPTQLKMFVTRLGFGTKIVITGDPFQSDLKNEKNNALLEVKRLFSNIKDIAIVVFDRLDVVRHPLVQKILKRYDDGN